MVAIPSVLPPSTAGSVASASSNDSLCELETLKELISTAKKAQKIYSKFSQAQVCDQCQRQATVAAAAAAAAVFFLCATLCLQACLAHLLCLTAAPFRTQVDAIFKAAASAASAERCEVLLALLSKPHAALSQRAWCAQTWGALVMQCKAFLQHFFD
jgi:hypothetical protein